MNSKLYIFFFLLLLSVNAPAEIMIIANKSVPVDNLSQELLLDIYSLEKRNWSGSMLVSVIDFKEKGFAKNEFYKILGKSSARIKSAWMRKVLSGECDPPLTIESDDQMLEKIATTKGAIGYIDSASLSFTNLDSSKVKILQLTQ